MAEIKPSYDTKRQKLSEVIPLDSPLSMYVEPTRSTGDQEAGRRI